MIQFIDRSVQKKLLDKDDTIALRGVSAFFVIAAHYAVWVDEMTDYAINVMIKGIVGQLGGIGVLIFFFVSGLGIFEAWGYRKADKTYLIKRFKSVYLPYVLIKVIFLAVDHALGLSSGKVISELVSILFMEDWFIHVIVIQYIVFFLASKINKRYLVTITVGADCILTVIYFCMNKPIRWFNALWLFAFGMFAAKYKEKIINLINKYYYQSLVASFICFVLSGYVFALNKGAVWANVFKPVSGMFLCLCICIIMRKCRLNSPIVMWGGHRSLYLYIVHIYILRILHFSEPILNFWMALVLVIIITEILFRLTNYICSKAFRKAAVMKKLFLRQM